MARRKRASGRRRRRGGNGRPFRNGNKPGVIPMFVAMIPEMEVGIDALVDLDRGYDLADVGVNSLYRFQKSYTGINPDGTWEPLNVRSVRDSMFSYGPPQAFGFKIAGWLVQKIGRKLGAGKFKVPFLGHLF